MSSKVIYEQVGTVAKVWLNNPKAGNATNFDMMREIDHAFKRAVEDDSVKVIVMLAKGAHFCTGHEQDEDAPNIFEDPSNFSSRATMLESSEETEMCMRLRNPPKPVVAGAQGMVIFHGFSLLSVADIIFAGDTLRVLAMYTNFLPAAYELGVRQTKDLLFRQRFLLPKDLEKVGYVKETVQVEELEKTVMAYANDIARNDAYLLRMMKNLCNDAADAQGYSEYQKRMEFTQMAMFASVKDPEYDGKYKFFDGIPEAIEKMKNDGTNPRRSKM